MVAAGVFKDIVCWNALREQPLKGHKEVLVDASPASHIQPHLAAFRGFCHFCIIQKVQNVLRDALPQRLWGQQVLSILTVSVLGLPCVI